MLAFLPLAAYIAIFLAIGNGFRQWGWRRAFVRSFVIVGAYMVMANEFLSLIGGITPVGLSIAWSAPILAAMIWAVRARRRGILLGLPPWRIRFTPLEWPLLLGVLVIAGVTAVVAWIAPPNTWDSLTYHMARVAHWAQDDSLRPFATGIERQNYMSPVAEIGMLQVYVLGQGDRLVNFIEWLSMVVSIVAVMLLARDLGAGRLGQLFSAVFVAALPMGIAQASSTMTDYVVAVWAIAIAVEGIQIAKGTPGSAPPVFAGLAAGLTVGSKPTGFAYLLPLAVFLGIALWRRRGLRETVKWAVVAAAIVLVLNAGYFGRNIEVYGNPLGRQSSVERHSNEVLDWRMFISNTLRNASLHAGTPSRKVNDWIYLNLAKFHVKLGLDLTDPRTTIHPDFLILTPTTMETRAGNLLQAILIVISFILAILLWRRVGIIAAAYSVVVALSFVALSVMFKFTVFGSRYHMGFFILYAPAAGYVLWRLLPRGLVALLGLGLIVASYQWVVGIHERPLIPIEKNSAPSILEATRNEMYLGSTKSYQRLTDAINGAQCSVVGVMISGNSPEYVLWVLLGAPREDLRMEWIVGGTASARYEDPAFQPCAIICDETCDQTMTSARELPLFMDIRGRRLFMRSDGTAPP